MTLFHKLSIKIKDEHTLKWFVEEHNSLISKATIENNPYKLNCAMLVDTLLLNHLRIYFDASGWVTVK